MSRPGWTEPLGMLLLRWGVAWFIFVWAVAKFLAPAQYQFILKRFDGVEVELTWVHVIGAAQVAICVLVFLGLFRTWSYAALVAIHGFTITRIWPRLVDPFEISEKGFPVNRNASIALAVFLAMVALWLLRHRDEWSVDAWLQRRRGGTPDDGADTTATAS